LLLPFLYGQHSRRGKQARRPIHAAAFELMARRNGASRPELSGAQWKRTRAAVRRRDGNACVVCGRTDRLSVHHVTPARLGGDDSMANLVTLCVAHHRQADAQVRRAELRSSVRAEDYVDDPEAGVFWDRRTNRPESRRRWSRPWYDWRAEELGQRK
jgi:hypothetical protein